MAWFSEPDSSTPRAAKHAERPVTLHNTMGNADEPFASARPGAPVRMYHCGPTVYGPAHIGNLRSYVFADILRRTLEYNGFSVKQVINITDVGHLSSDADEGEDKMTKGLKREGLAVSLENMRLLAGRYEERFKQDLATLDIETAGTQFPRASEHIAPMIAMIQTLEQKGYTYKTSDGIYYDTSRFPEYGKLGGIDVAALKEGARIEANVEKKNPADFALWKFDDALGFESPFGKGFPGWHIECSAMSRVALGEQLDIHTGGIDHIPVHHNNEIAQSEAATGKKPFARIWMHNAFITIDDEKIAKSLGNAIDLDELPKHGIHPLALRYYYLGAHYRTPVNFSWAALKSAQQALLRLHFLFDQMPVNAAAEPIMAYQQRFHERINADLDTPGALAIAWELVKDTSFPAPAIRATLLDFDTVLGLSLGAPDAQLARLIIAEFGEIVPAEKLSKTVADLITAREEARGAKDWTKADALRAQVLQLGYALEDTPAGPRVLRKEIVEQEEREADTESDPEGSL
ncbi:MAG TPA: cysteine--tRNA ligase [Candidatus Paceibacterota bacterium]|nr:cysteine--tRNA ligase [Candidatus Paceibacterota bacterium]